MGSEKRSEKEIFNIPKEDFSTWYEEVLKRAEVVDKRYPVKGMDVFLSYGLAIHESIIGELERMWDESGHEKVLFPTLIPEDIFKREEEHIKGFSGEVYWVTHGGGRPLDVRLLMRPTSEVPMYVMFKEWIRSHADLPLKIHQTCTVFRYETKATKSLIRVREIPWNEAHSVHATWEEADAHVRDVWRYYTKLVVDYLGINGLLMRRPEWDKFHGADYTTVIDALMPDGRMLQIVGNHHLGEKFARAFDIKYEDENGEKHYVNQVSYGVSTRLTAAMFSIHGDQKGLVIPYPIAPIQAVLVPIVYKGREEAVMKKCEELLEKLKKAGIRARVDSRDKTPGEKFYYWEMKGVPIRVEVGPRDAERGEITLVRRDTGERKQVKEDSIEEVEALGKEILKNLRHRSEEDIRSRIKDADTLEEAAEVVRKRMVVRASFCSRELDGMDCAETVKERCDGAQVRGTLFPEPESADEKICIVCGRPAGEIVYIAKAY
ncbi:MAG: proline--tRNA ligase [Candidatus Hydrothermarchaeaceae archaeon]